MKSAVESNRAAAKRYTSVYYALGTFGEGGYEQAIAQRRRFTTKDGELLDGEAAVRVALARDGEVWCEPGDAT